MPLIPDTAVFQKTIAALPLATYQAGETVLTAGSTTGRLLILKEGAVEVVKEDVQIAKVVEPGAVFGELSALLDQPHTADIRALETSHFHVADASALLVRDPIALLYVAAVLARRLDGANRAIIELRHQVETPAPQRAWQDARQGRRGAAVQRRQSHLRRVPIRSVCVGADRPPNLIEGQGASAREHGPRRAPKRLALALRAGVW